MIELLTRKANAAAEALLDHIAEVHYDPSMSKLDPQWIDEFDIASLRSFIQTDEKSHYIRHNGEYLLYVVRDKNLEFELLMDTLFEFHARYSNREMDTKRNMGWEC